LGRGDKPNAHQVLAGRGFGGTLKASGEWDCGRLKTREWKTWHQIAVVKNAGVAVSYSIRKM